jgi:protein-S-isoprenylcysteine O-methyltransferase Ste14
MLVPVATAIYLGLAILFYGGITPFFSRLPLVVLFAIFVVLAIVSLFAGGRLSRGIREARNNRWVIGAFAIVGLTDAFVPAWTDRVGLWTIDGDAIRWLGVALVAIGGPLRIAPVFVLGNRFSGLVAIQLRHQLVTTGMYGVIRHPSYLGLLLMVFGWGLSFRSVIGVLLGVLLILPIVARINAEESLLRSRFGSEYDAYLARTSRLIPGVY